MFDCVLEEGIEKESVLGAAKQTYLCLHESIEWKSV